MAVGVGRCEAEEVFFLDAGRQSNYTLGGSKFMPLVRAKCPVNIRGQYIRRILATAVVLAMVAVMAAIVTLRRDGGGGGGGGGIVSAQPRRIVSMAPNLTEILFELGLGDRVVGVTIHSNHPPSAADKPKMGTFWQPNIETIVAARPDLVVTLGFARQQQLAVALARIGCSCLTVNIEDIAGLFAAIEKIGAATDRVAEASAMVSRIKSAVGEVGVGPSRRAGTRVLMVVQREPLRVAGTDTFVHEMIELAGGVNAIGPTIQKYPPIGAEQLLICTPDVIIEAAMLKEDTAGQRADAVKYWSRFDNVPAVKNGRIYTIDGDVVSRLGPRLADAVGLIAGCLQAGVAGD